MDDGDDEEQGTPEFESKFERRMQALSLRNGGMTFTQIAGFQKISAAQARRDVEWAKRHIAGEDIETIISVQRSVIIDMRRANYQAMLQGNKDAAAAILKGLDHEAKLLGLYAPVRVQTGPSHVEFSERAAELISKVSPDTIKELVRGTSVFRAASEQQRADSDAAEAHEPEPLDVDIVATPFGPAVRGPMDAQSSDSVGAQAPRADDHGDDQAHPEPVERREPEPDGDDWSNIG